MSTTAYLPCLVCGKTLPNVFEDADNQPYGGTAFTTEGHYGSTFWDSFDGEDLVITVCDDCLHKHTDRLGQRKAYLPVFCGGMMVGRRPVDRPLLAYTGNPDPERLEVDVEELGTSGEGIVWAPDINKMKKELEETEP